MIKIVGFGKKRIGLSREECVKYHIENHAPFGRRVAGPLGLKKYMGYYPERALSLDGKVLPELPWDFIVPEWFSDEFFNNISAWRTTDPDGIAITEDEARFCDRENGYMMTCQENVIVSPGNDNRGTNVMFLLTKKSDLSHEECIEYHKEKYAPMTRHMLSPHLKSCTAYYVDQAFHLTKGLTPARPYDIVVLVRFDDEFWKGMAAWQKTPEGIKLAKDEESFIDRSNSAVLECKVSIFIP